MWCAAELKLPSSANANRVSPFNNGQGNQAPTLVLQRARGLFIADAARLH